MPNTNTTKTNEANFGTYLRAEIARLDRREARRGRWLDTLYNAANRSDPGQEGEGEPSPEERRQMRILGMARVLEQEGEDDGFQRKDLGALHCNYYGNEAE